jgi:hypothetical protein
VWSQIGAKQTPSFRVHYPRRIKISVVVVMWLDKWAMKEGNVEVKDCKPFLFSCPLITIKLVLEKMINVEWKGEGFGQWSAPHVKEILGHWEFVSHKGGKYTSTLHRPWIGGKTASGSQLWSNLYWERKHS